jgi:hypothetical protein
MWDTTTSITCSPTTIESHSLTTASCHVTVTSPLAPTVATGSVGFTASGTNSWSANGAPCTLILATGYAYCDITSVSTTGPTGTMTIYAGYGGDSSHTKSTGSFDLSVVSPPSAVTVSGTATTKGFGTTAAQINFIDSGGITHTALINSGSYTIDLSNLSTYTVTIYYTFFGGSSTCRAGTLNLQSSTTTWRADWSC